MSVGMTVIQKSENLYIFIIGLITFVNVLDFMIVMPLGPDFTRSLDIGNDKIGLITASYTFAAAIMGFICSFILDRFDRRKAILCCLLSLASITALSSMVFNLESMVAARILAGISGGPLTALCSSFVSDIIPANRRGYAFGKIMGAFSIASIFGVPLGLELSHYFGWRSIFFLTGFAAFIVWVVAYKFLPSNINIISRHTARESLLRTYRVVTRYSSISALSIVLFSMGSMFLIVPNVSPYFQMNLSYPREDLGLLYLIGGLISFFSMRITGKIVDLKGPTFVATISYMFLTATFYFGFIHYQSFIPPLLIFVTLMIASTSRNVAMQTINTKVPKEDERGTYMSLNSMLNHVGTSSGAYFSSVLLYEQNGILMNMNLVATIAIIISSFVPLLFYITERHLRKDVRYIVLPEV